MATESPIPISLEFVLGKDLKLPEKLCPLFRDNVAATAGVISTKLYWDATSSVLEPDRISYPLGPLDGNPAHPDSKNKNGTQNSILSKPTH
jgi:hypothetical protein